MARQEMAINLENIMGYLKLLMAYPYFWDNQIYKPSCIYDDNKQQVYNIIYIGKLWWKQQKKHTF